jgi:hypothetical protein
MGIVTLKIDDELEKKLRMKVGQRGISRGALSEGVEEALRLWLGINNEEHRTYYALLKGKEVARADTLDNLAKKLKELGLDTREVIVRSSPAPRDKFEMGFRYKERGSKA